MIKVAATSAWTVGIRAAPFRQTIAAAPRSILLSRLYNTEASSHPQFVAASPTTGAPITQSNTPSHIDVTRVPPTIVTSSSGGPGNNGPKPKKKRGFFSKVKRTLGLLSVIFLGSSAYYLYVANHPPDQLPQDPSKKTIVVLGSGWGSTALLDGIDTTDYNVIVISPYNYFLFTPLLPSVTVGTLNGRSITQPTRHVVRYKKREVQVLEAEATKVDAKNKTVTFEDRSAIYGNLGTQKISYDYLVYAVGSENQTFGIEGVKKHGLFLKELGDAEAIRRRLMDCVEKASLLGQSEEEIDRLLHFAVVGGGPTGVEASGELRDFVRDDLSKWYPAVSGRVKVTLIEALPNILPSFSNRLSGIAAGVFKDNEIEILTKHSVKDADETSVTVKNPEGKEVRIPIGMLVWAAGNTARPLTRDLQGQFKDIQDNRRGIMVDGFLRMKGASDIFVIGDAAATDAPPTAQVANQQGHYLASVFQQLNRLDILDANLTNLEAQGLTTDGAINDVARAGKKLERSKASLKEFHYTNRGAMAYIGSERAVIEVPFGNTEFSSAGFLTGLAWSSAYWSMLFGIRSRTSVALDWLKVRLFGRDVTV
ncbi:hypothetical protein CBS101457_003436 [Exobasidium rhododendri]|nr:hypothetical protein CBS101457_003436 [Exobasidium rhododendri]